MYQSEPIEIPSFLTYSGLPDEQGRVCDCSEELAIARDSKAENPGCFFRLCLRLIIPVAVGVWRVSSPTLGCGVDSWSA